MNETKIKNLKPNTEKLLSFGFVEQEDCYTYSRDLADGQMNMLVSLSKDGELCTKIIDTVSNEEYVLHRMADVSGAFVGQIKEEYQALLDEISAKCFEPDVFKSSQAKSLIAYVRDTYGDELEFLWKKFPDNAIWRRKDNQKWYAALLTVSRKKLGFDEDTPVEILDVRMKPEDIETMVDGKKYLPGYHMNKRHWITLCLDGTVPFAELCQRIDDSYKLAIK